MLGLKTLFEKARRNRVKKHYRVVAGVYVKGLLVHEIPIDQMNWNKADAEKEFKEKVTFSISRIHEVKKPKSKPGIKPAKP